MRLAAQGVEDEDVEVLQQRNAFRRDVAHVGKVGSRAEAIAGNGLASMSDRDAEKCCTEQFDGSARCLIDAVESDTSAGGVTVDLAEGVFEDALDGFGSGIVSVERHAIGLAEAQWAKVVHAEDVVGVTV